MVIIYLLAAGRDRTARGRLGRAGPAARLPRGVTGPLVERLGVAVAAGRPAARHCRRDRGRLDQNRAAREGETLTPWPRC